jgi:alpha-beta hydrolase superfamily lysophospholipase
MPKHQFIINNGISLYVRHISPKIDTNQAVIIYNGYSSCVESQFGISMGSVSYGDYLASRGIHVFLVDIRGSGLSTSTQEQEVGTMDKLTDPLSPLKYNQDIMSSIRYVKRTLGKDIKISVIGYSFIASILVAFTNLFPNEISNLIIFNPRYFTDLEEIYTPSYVAQEDNLSYRTLTFDSMVKRFTLAPPKGMIFMEESWSEEVLMAYKKFTRTFDYLSKSWIISRPPNMRNYMLNNINMINSRSSVLMISSQYDSEYPTAITRDFFDSLRTPNKEFRILPDATHLCIWEKARHTLYEWTADFILRNSDV